MQLSESPVQPVYLLIDASGSTARSGFNSACNRALPHLLGSLEEEHSCSFHLSILTFGTQSSTSLALANVRTVQFLPHIASRGFSSLAAGLRGLGTAVFQDAEQLRVDRVPGRRALAVLLTDGLPTDSSDDLRTAYQECCARAGGNLSEVLVVLTGGEVAASVAGLGQGLAEPDLDVVELPVLDPAALTVVIAGWLTRIRSD